jgi:nicotinate phosphoribosyltransferase
VRHAIDAACRLREAGHELIGIRLDSGDLAYLSIEARKLLDEAGFAEAVIVGSNDLDEHIIASLKEQGATIGLWGVGTKLATGFDEPALGGVYKLTALRSPDARWTHKVKLSEQAVKVSTPGILQVRRFHRNGGAVADMVYDELSGVPEIPVIVDPVDPTRQRKMDDAATSEDLLVPVIRQGKVVYDPPPLTDIQRRADQQLRLFHAGIRRRTNPHEYPVGLERNLHLLKTQLVLAARGLAHG